MKEIEEEFICEQCEEARKENHSNENWTVFCPTHGMELSKMMLDKYHGKKPL